MAQQTINVGTSPNDGTGTPLRTAFQYTNSNFSELYTALGGGAGLPGASTQVLFNNGTNIAGDAGLVYNSTTDALTIGGNVGAASATITGDLTVDTSTLKVDSTNNRVGIGTATPAVTLDVAGAIQIPSGSAGGLFQFAYGASASSRSWRVWNDVSANGDFHIATSTTRTGSTYSDRYVVDVSANHFWYNTSGVTATLDSSGNLGLGIAPSAGGSNYYKTFELGKAGCGLFVATNTLTSSELTYLSGNGVLKYNAGPEWSYGNAGSAAIYGIEDGVHKWYNAGSGSAGGVFVPTQAMTLDASGNLGIGTTSPQSPLEIAAAASSKAKALQFSSVGSPTYGYIFAVDGAVNGNLYIQRNVAGVVSDVIEVDRSNGNVIFTPSSTPTSLGTNGQLTMNATSNTNLRFSYRGSDGVTRVANITLA